MLFSSLQSNRYIADQWMRRNGDSDLGFKNKWNKVPQDIACDDRACRYQKNNQKVSILNSQSALKEECDWADMIIFDQPLSSKQCSKALLLDRFDTYRDGAYSIWLSKNTIHLKSVSQGRGERPWTNP